MTQEPTKVRSRRCTGIMSSGHYENMCTKLESSMGNNLTKEESKKLKAQRRSLKNRAAAMRSRERKRKRLDFLEAEYSKMRDRLTELEEQNEELKRENMKLQERRDHSRGGSIPSITSDTKSPAPINMQNCRNTVENLDFCNQNGGECKRQRQHYHSDVIDEKESFLSAPHESAELGLCAS